MPRAHTTRIPEPPEPPEPLELEDAAEVAPRDSEVDFDDDSGDDQLPLDVKEAREVGVLLDDPEVLSDEA